MKEQISLKKATPKDVDTILYFIRAIAKYEKLLDRVKATKEGLYESIFIKKACEVLLAYSGQKAVGFALYFFNFSTFEGKRGLYLEDIFVEEEYRGEGIGKMFFKELAKIALKEDCARMEWVCLDWNKSSIDFYLSLGAKAMSGWSVYRVEKEGIKALEARLCCE